MLFAVSQKLPKPILVASGVFAGLSYEFYILHFYFINDRFNDFFAASTPLYGQAIIAFVITFILAYVISKGAARFKQVADNYLLESPISQGIAAFPTLRLFLGSAVPGCGVGSFLLQEYAREA